MKKTLALLLTLALSMAALTGCGSKTETPADTNTDSSAQTETPAEAALSGSVSTNGSTSMEKVIGALSEQFMADNSGVTVSYDPTGSGTGIEAAKNGTMEEAWGTGTAAVVSPIGELAMEGKKVTISGNQIGELTQKLYDTLTGIQWGKLEDKYGWTTPVE